VNAKNPKLTDVLDASDAQLSELLPGELSRAERRIERVLEEEAKGFPYLRDRRWSLAFRRAYAILRQREHKRVRRGEERSRGPLPTITLEAALVADYHAWKWADDEVRKLRQWPSLTVLLGSWQVQDIDLVTARQRARHHAWEKNYVLAESKDVRLEKVRRQVMRDVEEMAEVPVEKRNPTTYRAAAELLGEGRKNEVHIGGRQTTYNLIAPGTDFAERLLRMNEVSAQLLKEVPREVESLELPQPPQEASPGAHHRPPEDGPADPA
jgi:hypothetical protein